ncbi:ABC transporter permease [Methylophilus sp. 13]|nr:ABC transporter permease [Methylophilus sp. 13]
MFDLPPKSVNTKPITTISSEKSSKDVLRDLWNFKDLLFLLTWRDLLVRYKQTFFGVAWAIFRPLITVMVFAFIFGKVAKLPSGNTPYFLFVFAGMIPWQFFSSSLSEAGNSLVANANIITKIYFPRLLMPLSSIAACLVDALITGIIFCVLLVWYQVEFTWHILILPAFIIWLVLLTIGLSIWTAALNVTYRDFRYLIPFMVQLGMYISPVGFSSQIIPDKWLWLFYINPMASIIDGFRWCIFNQSSNFNVSMSITGIVITLLMFVYGLIFFKNAEDSFADRI